MGVEPDVCGRAKELPHHLYGGGVSRAFLVSALEKCGVSNVRLIYSFKGLVKGDCLFFYE